MFASPTPVPPAGGCAGSEPLSTTSMRSAAPSRAARDRTGLRLEVVDTGGGPAQPHAGGNGIGLANTSARLRHLYGLAGRLEIEVAPEGGTLARIRVPYHPAPADQVA